MRGNEANDCKQESVTRRSRNPSCDGGDSRQIREARAMRRRTLTTATLLMGLVAMGFIGGAVDVREGPPLADRSSASAGSVGLAPEVQVALETLIDDGATAVVVDVYEGEERSSDTAGGRSHDGHELAEVDDRLRIASVSKTITATVIMQLVESGELVLNTTVDEVLPGLLDAHGPVTAEQLLNHTSGLPNYFEVIAPPS